MTTAVQTKPELKVKVDPHAPAKRVFTDENIQRLACYLYQRWQDEKEYEDFGNYKKAIAFALVNHHATLVRMTQRPFAFVFETTSRLRYQITVTAKHYKIKQVQK